MTLAIINSLLRVEGVSGEAPPPFERPNERMNFWVLELPEHADIDAWCIQTVKVLTAHDELFRRMRDSHFAMTLFIQTAATVPVLRLDSAFLKALTEFGIALECSHENA